jgi:acyl-CoA thioester hydrolase
VCKGFDWNQYAIFVVKIEVEFFAQIKGEDSIAVRTRTVHLGNKSFRLEQEIFDIDTQEVKSRCMSILVLYDLEQKQSIPFPDEWRQAIRDYDGIL